MWCKKDIDKIKGAGVGSCSWVKNLILQPSGPRLIPYSDKRSFQKINFSGSLNIKEIPFYSFYLSNLLSITSHWSLKEMIIIYSSAMQCSIVPHDFGRRRGRGQKKIAFCSQKNTFTTNIFVFFHSKSVFYYNFISL